MKVTLIRTARIQSFNRESPVSPQAFQLRDWVVFNWMVRQRVTWNSPNNPCWCQDKRLPPTYLQKGHIAEKSNHTTHTTWRSQTDIYINPSFLFLVSSMCEGTCWLLKEKHGNKLRHKTFGYNLSGTIYYGNGSTGLEGSSQPMSDLT